STPANQMTFTTAWLGAIGYTLQLFFDFSAPAFTERWPSYRRGKLKFPPRVRGAPASLEFASPELRNRSEPNPWEWAKR
ncbi:hypothetical protein, partial [Amycolatopsis sp. NPDC003676]